MKLLAIMGSPRKGKATDTLVDRAIEGFRSKALDYSTKKINLIDHEIKHCRNCLICRDTVTDQPSAPCTIRDDMDIITGDLHQSDALILGTPVHMGFATALMTAFLERICWTFAKPERRILTIKGCPVPRFQKKREAVIIVTSGIVPPVFRRFCDQAAPLIRGVIKDSLNARTIGDLYAGDIEHRGVERYLDKAFKLGEKLA
jgi:multimeric flavodoxin WrbA